MWFLYLVYVIDWIDLNFTGLVTASTCIICTCVGLLRACQISEFIMIGYLTFAGLACDVVIHSVLSAFANGSGLG